MGAVNSMEQLLIHLFGDYISQTEKMASEKTKSYKWAAIHAAVYTIPFILLTRSELALFVIFFSHFLIDRFRLARFVIFAKNKVTSPSLKWVDCSDTGFHKNTPPWLAVWLMIIIDNTIHMIINYLSIGYL